MQLTLHANAVTTPKTRAYIQASTASVAELAAELGVNETTIRRWRGRQTPGTTVPGRSASIARLLPWRKNWSASCATGSTCRSTTLSK